MAVPVSLHIDCSNAELQKQLDEDLCNYLQTSVDLCEIETESTQSRQTTQLEDCYDDNSDSEQIESPLLCSPIIISRLNDFIYKESSTDSVLKCRTAPTSIDLENEDPFGCVSETNDLCGRNCTKKCLSQLPSEHIHEHRMNMMELEKDSKDMLLMGQLQACGISQGDHTRKGERKRHKFNYQYNNIDVCKDCFLFVNGIGVKYLKNLKKHMKTFGIVPRTHGNFNRKPKHALTYEDAKRVVTFLEGYSHRYGMPQPAAKRGRDDTPPVYLPRSYTYISVHKEYESSCQEMDARILSETTFRRIWHQCVPHITFMDNQTDVCPICEDFQDKVKTRFNTEAERLEVAHGLTEHLHGAQAERDFYKEQCKKATEELQGHQKVQNPDPCSQDLYNVHYTFDFANSVLVPSHVRQEGPLYYKSPLKCVWFGVCNDGRTAQTNYIYSEENCIGLDGAQGHSSNAVVSMLDHYFSNMSEGEKRCSLNADNCGGQNKNQIVTGYLCWRILTGLHEEIYLHFMKPYHARCLVDGMFGLGRKSLRRNDIDCVTDVTNVIAKSTKYASVVQYDTGSQNPSWLWRDWKAFLKPLFRPVPHIQNYQHFRFSATHPGSVFVRETVNSVEKEIPLLKKGKVVESDMLPTRLECGGLSAARSWYLYNNLRQFVHNPHKDTTCPKPSRSNIRTEE